MQAFLCYELIANLTINVCKDTDSYLNGHFTLAVL